jgi:hypothetical protein
MNPKGSEARLWSATAGRFSLPTFFVRTKKVGRHRREAPGETVLIINKSLWIPDNRLRNFQNDIRIVTADQKN